MSSKPILLDRYTKVVLTLIALFAGIIALRPLVRPAPIHAQSDSSFLYVEPGVTTLRRPDGTAQVEGKMMIDLRTGDIFGFPTLIGGPYPVDPAHSEPPVSRPMYLGRFDLSQMKH